MASRYALRELEGAIGYDCRRLRDGRPALFMHTFLHRRARRDFFERRDLVDYLRMSYMSMSCISSNPRISIDEAIDVVAERRSSFMKAIFPYIDIDVNAGKKPKEMKYEDYSEYFDELDRLEAMNMGAEGSSSDSGGSEDVSEDGGSIS